MAMDIDAKEHDVWIFEDPFYGMRFVIDVTYLRGEASPTRRARL